MSSNHVGLSRIGQVFLFGSFTLDMTKHRLAGPAGEIALRPKSFELLVFMIERPGRVLTKSDLIKALWPDVSVTEESLTRCVSDVRVALQDGERSIVKTVPKLGYMLDVSVTVAAEPNATLLAVDPARATDGSSAAGSGGRSPSSVIFVNVQAELEKLSARDAEDAMTVHDDALVRLSAILSRYGATLQVVPGEGLVGHLGVPLAQEDHAIRACRAAIECHQAAAATMPLARTGAGPFLLRIGIASGDVIFRPAGGALQQEWNAMGSAVDQAKRLGRAALPGTTLIAGETRRLVDGQISVSINTALPDGTSGSTWQIVGRAPLPMTRFKASLARGLTRFVGRESELEQLRRARQLAARGHGQVVAIVGEAGVGKSRLVHELINNQDSVPQPTILSCTAVSLGSGTAFLPLVEMLRDYFKIETDDDIPTIRNKISTRLVTLDRAMEASVPAMLALLDVPTDDASWPTLDPGERRRRTLDAIRRLLLQEARAQPLILIVEDLHWIDAQTQALLDTLVDSLAATRLTMIVTYRPEYRHGWGGKSSYRQLRLDSLTPESTARLLDDLLGEDVGHAQLKQLLARRGNPFFLEEAIRTLSDTGTLVGQRGAYLLTRAVDTVQLPPTVQAILAARIDRLHRVDKQTLQIAAAIGKVFPFRLLKAAADETEDALTASLDRLQSVELIHQTGLQPDDEYTFRHALTHEVTYAGMLRAHRRELHSKIAEAMEAIYRDRLPEHTERIAHHAFHGELGGKAVHYLRQAGLRAAARSALTEARAFLEQALTAFRQAGDGRTLLEQGFEICLELRGVLYQLGDARALLQRLQEAEAIAEELQDQRRKSRVAAFMTSIHTMLGRLDEAVAIGERSVTSARTLGDLELQTNAANYLVQAYYYRGDYEQAIELASETLAAWPNDWEYKYHVGNPAPPSVFNRAFLAMSLAQLGRFSEAAGHEAEAIALAEPTQNAFTMAVAHVSTASLFPLKGDWHAAKTRLERYMSVARTGNIIGLLTNAVAAYTWVVAELGDRSEAEARLNEANGLLEKQAPRGIGNLCWPYFTLGRACLLLDRPTEARTLADRALALSTSQPGFAAHALNLMGDIECLCHPTQSTRAESFYQQALALAAPRGMRPLIAACSDALTKLAGPSAPQI